MTPPSEEDWRRVIPSLRAVALRRGLSAAEADDAVQRALEKALRHLGRAAPVARFGPWLRRIAANEAIDHQRAMRSAPGRLVRIEAECSEAEAAAAASAALTEPEADPLLSYIDCLEPFMQRLAPADRDALILKDREGLTFAALAERLGLSTPGAKARVQRARRRLAKALTACCEELSASPPAPMPAQDCAGSCCGSAERR